MNTTPGFHLSFHLPSLLTSHAPNPSPPKHTSKDFFHQEGPHRGNTEKELPPAGKGQPSGAWGPGWLCEPGSPLALPRACSRPLGRQNPPSRGAQPGLTVTAAAVTATRGLLLALACPDHAPPIIRPAGVGASLTPPEPTPKGGLGDTGNEGRRRPAFPAQGPSSATLTCGRARAWAAALATAAASLVVVALARRLRPPPPRSLSLPPPQGLMRDPRFLLRRPRPGEGAPGPQKTPTASPAAAPKLPVHTGGLRARLFRTRLRAAPSAAPRSRGRRRSPRP